MSRAIPGLSGAKPGSLISTSVLGPAFVRSADTATVGVFSRETYTRAYEAR
jgi:hypothetical protein